MESKIKTIIVSILILCGILLVINYSHADIIMYDILNDFPSKDEVSKDTLVSGKFNDDKSLIDNMNYVSIKGYIPMLFESFRVTMPDETYKVEIREYDSKMEYINTTTVGHLDYFTKDSKTKYLLLSFYKMDCYGDIIDFDYDTLYNEIKQKGVSFEKIEKLNSDEYNSKDPELANYLNTYTFMNTANLRPGIVYGGWGADYHNYTKDTGDITSRNIYKVLPNTTYYVSSNDARYLIYLTYYNSNGEFMYEAYDWQGGSGRSTFTTPNEEGVFVVVNFKSASNISIQDLFYKNKIKVSINTDGFYYDYEKYINDDKINLSDASNYIKGDFGYRDTCYYNDDDLYVIKYKLRPSNIDNIYIYKTNDDRYNIRINEYDKDGNKIKTTNLKEDNKFRFNQNTSFYTLAIYSDYKKGDEYYRDLLDSFNNYKLNISFDVFKKYKHNTTMKDITSRELLNKLTTGWNLGDSFESTDFVYESSNGNYFDSETYWGNPYVTESFIKYVKDLGFNNIRIPVTWSDNYSLDEYGNYVINKDYLSRVSEVVDYAIKYDMYVVINTHYDAGKSNSILNVGGEDENYVKSLKYAKQVWTQIADYFKDYDEHLIFEGYNELGNSRGDERSNYLSLPQTNELNQVFVDTVRNTKGNNSKRILMVQTYFSTTTSSTLNGFILPSDRVKDKLIAQVHMYPTEFDEAIEPHLEALENFSNRINAPVVIGEFGIPSSYTPTSLRKTAISNLIARAKKHNILVYMWDNGYEYQIINRKERYKTDQTLVDAVLKAKEYTSPKGVTLNKVSDFGYHTLNQGTGEYKEDIWWGSLTTDYIEVPKDNNQYIKIKEYVKNDAESRLIHLVFFYDENKNFIKDQSYNNSYPGYSNLMLVVPNNAKYVRIQINSSWEKTSKEQFENFIKNKELYLSYTFMNVPIDRTLLDEKLKDGEVMISSYEDFNYNRLDTSNGELVEDIWWGSIASKYLKINDNATKFEYRWTTRGTSSDLTVHYFVFYDKDKNYISEGAFHEPNPIGVNSKVVDIPSNAKYVKIGINSSTSAKSKSDYATAFKNGDATLIYSSY